MRIAMTCLIAAGLAMSWSPGLADEAPLSVYHYTPCEALWVDGGHHIGLLVGGKYRCGRFSSIAFPPLNDAELDGVVQQLKREGYLERSFPDERARAILHRLDGCVSIQSWDTDSNPVRSALLKCWLYRKASGLPPQVYLWLSVAGADAVYLDESSKQRLSSGAGGLALYAYSIDRVTDKGHSSFQPLGFAAFRMALEKDIPLTADDWPSQYSAQQRPWVDLICSDELNSTRLSVGQWFIAESPYAVRVEFNQETSEDAGWERADGSSATPDSFAVDDRGRVAFALEIIQFEPEESDLYTILRLLVGQGLVIDLDHQIQGSISVMDWAFTQPGVDRLWAEAGFD